MKGRQRKITCFFYLFNIDISSIIRQKGEYQNGCFKKKKDSIFSKKHYFLRTCAYQGVRNVGFSENLACFVFLKHPFWNSPFCLITDDFTFGIPQTIQGQCSNAPNLKDNLHDKSIGLVLSGRIIDLKLWLWLIILLLYVHKKFNLNV